MNFLATIQAEKRREVAAKRAAIPLDALRERALAADAPRDFLGAVSRRGAVVAELKARTPTVASFAHSRSLLDLAAVYEQAGASAISVVTDPARFGTSYADVARVRSVIALPVIAKDFVIDPYQVVEARAAGADAVLLIVRLLELDTLRDLLELAHELEMSALVETHMESEILAALAVGARIVGVNNRDLDTMAVSLDATRRLAHLAPDDVVLVSESGIRTPEDVADLSAHGARAFLVGGSLLDAPDAGSLLRRLVEAARGARAKRSAPGRAAS
jgi:indole-3-glycerol phosphate synthase